MKNTFNICLTIIIGLTFITCNRKATHVDVDANVYITKLVDSLPCQANIEYSDLTNRKTTQAISSDWTVHHNLHYDQYVELKATGVSNIKTLTVEITAKSLPVSNSCSGNNCTVEVRKNLYN